MLITDWNAWEARFAQFLTEHAPPADPAHDLAHIRRVVATAKHLSESEGANLEVVLPAAWLHDCVAIPKSSERRVHASRDAARKANAFLSDAGYPSEHLPAIRHAIEAHSYSAGIPPETMEAKVVQDADRLDALGAIGIARCFMVGALLGPPLYDPDDPFSEDRPPDDRAYILDHFYTKLLTLAGTLHTEAGRAEAERRIAFMRTYLDQLRGEVEGGLP